MNPGSEAAGMRFQHSGCPSVNVNVVAAFPLVLQQLIPKTIVDAACFWQNRHAKCNIYIVSCVINCGLQRVRCC